MKISIRSKEWIKMLNLRRHCGNVSLSRSSRQEIMIRYWGRKSKDLAETYIKRYTKPDQIVADFFGGSGVFVKTAVELKRRAIYVDLNPFAYLVAKSSITPCNFTEFIHAAKALLADQKLQFKKNGTLYECSCSELFSIYCNCGNVVEVSWVKYGRIYNKLYRAPIHLSGKKYEVYMSIASRKDISHDELMLLHPELTTQTLSSIVKWLVRKEFVREVEVPLEASLTSKCTCGKQRLDLQGEIKWLIDGDIEPFYWYPNDKLEYHNGTPFLKRRDVSNVSELFTKRNLVFLTTLWEKIKKQKVRKSIKDCLRVAFMATLARSSKMCRVKGGTWPINSYWIPRVYVVKNPYIVFKDVVAQFSKALRDKLQVKLGNVTEVLDGRADVACLLADSTRLKLPNDSIDYVLVDPPHTDEAQFFELSLFYTSWLKRKLNFKNELIINNRRGKNFDEYLKMLSEASRNIYYSLRKKRYYTIIFHGDDKEVLETCRKAICEVGFKFVEKEVINGYTVYTFKKP